MVKQETNVIFPIPTKAIEYLERNCVKFRKNDSVVDYFSTFAYDYFIDTFNHIHQLKRYFLKDGSRVDEELQEVIEVGENIKNYYIQLVERDTRKVLFSHKVG